MLAASRAAWVPVFMATATSAWARAGASLVPSPVMATMPPACLVLPDQLELGLRGGLGQEVVHPGLRGDGRGGQGVVAGDHDGPDAHLAQVHEALLEAALDDVLQVDTPRTLAVPRDHQGRAAGLATVIHRTRAVPRGLRRRLSLTNANMASGAPFADAAPRRYRPRSSGSAP